MATTDQSKPQDVEKDIQDLFVQLRAKYPGKNKNLRKLIKRISRDAKLKPEANKDFVKDFIKER
jgi:hypothetical protein